MNVKTKLNQNIGLIENSNKTFLISSDIDIPDSIEIGEFDPIVVLPLDKELSDIEIENLKKDFKLAEMISQIILNSQKRLNIVLDKRLFLSLLNHLCFSKKLLEEGKSPTNELLDEIRKVYKKEFELGKEAIKLINDKLEIDLTQSEAGYIALYLAKNKTDKKLNIIKKEQEEFLNNKLKSNLNLSFKNDREKSKFNKYISDLIERLYTEDIYKQKDLAFYRVIKKNYSCTHKEILNIVQELFEKYNIWLSENEIINLIIEINKYELNS